MLQPFVRLVVAITLAIGLASVPVVAVHACSCAFLGYPEAIGEADLAFVGTVIDADEPDRDAFAGGLAEVAYAIDVERAKSPTPNPVTVHTHLGDGANCGLDLNVGERWLVIASAASGRPETNLCTGTTPYDGMDPETRAMVDPLLTETAAPVEESPPEESMTLPPTPALALIGATLLIAAVSVAAFRRERSS